MATASVPNTFVAATNADPDEVNANFTSLVDFANNNTVHRDGSKAMTAAFDAGSFKLTNVATGVAGTDAVNVTQLNAAVTTSVPTGAVWMFSTGTAPSGWLLCDGSAVSRTTYATLFGVIGTTYGVGDGSTTFNLPNFSSKFPYGGTPGATGGSADAVVVTHSHTDTLAAPAHTHSVDPPNTATTSTSGGTPSLANATGGAVAVGSAAFGAEPLDVHDGGTAFQGGADFNDFSFNSLAAHSHSVNIAAFTSGGASATALTGSIASEGVSGTNANLPPYLGISFIIKT